MATLNIIRDIDNKRYSTTFEVVNLDTAEQEKVDDFGEPSVTFGGTIDVTTSVTPIEVASATGFAIGDALTGAPSGATGTISHIDANILYVSAITGTFALADTVTGAPSGANSTISNIFASQTLFEAQYGVAPNSPADFSKTQVIRQLVSGSPITYLFDGNSETYAKENALDFIVVHRKAVIDAWAAFELQLDDFSGTETVSL